jgi:hypothetical protein
VRPDASDDEQDTRPVLFSKKRKSGELITEQELQLTSKAKLAGGPKGTKAPGADRQGAQHVVDEQLSHARSKILELERQLEESQMRTKTAQLQVDEYQEEAQSEDALKRSKLPDLRCATSFVC